MTKPEDYQFEEYGRLGQLWSWLIIIGLCLFLVASGLVVHRLLPDRPRDWNYGALQTIPGDSIYSTLAPDPGPVGPAETAKIPQQIEPLPEAEPLQKLKPVGYQRDTP